MKPRPRARSSVRVPRTPLGMLFDLGSPTEPIRYVAGKVTATGTDTLTALIQGEEIPRIAVLGDMPEIDDLVDIYQIGDLLYVPAAGGIVLVHHGEDPDVPRPSASWVLWLGTAEPTHAKPYDGWEEANI